jgi:hypothetical protein
MKVVLRILAALLIGIGIIWVLQGVNILPGSFMTGHIQWAYRGAGCIVAGVVLFFLCRGRKGKIA